MQACVVNGTPLKQRDYDAIAAAARAHVTISAAIPKIRMLSECGFVTRAFEAIVKNDCGALEGNSGTVGKAALLAGIGLTFAAFLFCACFGCEPRLEARRALRGTRMLVFVSLRGVGLLHRALRLRGTPRPDVTPRERAAGASAGPSRARWRRTARRRTARSLAARQQTATRCLRACSHRLGALDSGRAFHLGLGAWAALWCSDEMVLSAAKSLGMGRPLECPAPAGGSFWGIFWMRSSCACCVCGTAAMQRCEADLALLAASVVGLWPRDMRYEFLMLVVL